MATNTKQAKKTVTSLKGWPRIGTLRKGDNGSYIKLNDDVEITVNGTVIPMNDKRVIRLEDPTESVDRLQERGIIDEKTADARREKLAEMTWLKYELVVAPPNPKKA